MSSQDLNTPSRGTPALLPAVDIAEDGAAITLTADLPGVEKDALTVHVEGRTLTLSAPLVLGESQALASVYSEVRANRYQRVFELSHGLDAAAIEAQLRDGVLTLRIPKLERARPRRIEIAVG